MKMCKLSDEEKKKIKQIIYRNMDDMEDMLNVKIRKLLNEHGIEKKGNLDAITYARTLFFKG